MQCVVFCHHHLPAFIIAVPILRLKQYYFNVLLKKSSTSSRKIESERQQSACVREHVEISWQLLCLLLYVWSYQHYFSFKQTNCFEVMSPLTPRTIEKLSRADNREKEMHVMFKRAETVMCHNFGYQLKPTWSITCIYAKDVDSISGKHWMAIDCIKNTQFICGESEGAMIKRLMLPCYVTHGFYLV